LPVADEKEYDMTNEQSQSVVVKLEDSDISGAIGADGIPMALADKQDRTYDIVVSANQLDNMRKQAVVKVGVPGTSVFSITCDEGPALGGDDTAPAPLAYFCASIAFCMLTQVARYAKMTKLKVASMHLEQSMRFSMSGSMVAGTMQCGVVGLSQRLIIESDEPEDQVRKMVRMGKQTCYIHSALANPIPTTTEVELNGSALDIG